VFGVLSVCPKNLAVVIAARSNPEAKLTYLNFELNDTDIMIITTTQLYAVQLRDGAVLYATST
jgi:hypothetical protein